MVKFNKTCLSSQSRRKTIIRSAAFSEAGEEMSWRLPGVAADGAQVKMMTSESMRTVDFTAAQMLLFRSIILSLKIGQSRSQSFPDNGWRCQSWSAALIRLRLMQCLI